MPQPDEITLRIKSIAAGGEGFGALDGKGVFVRGTAPGELVRCRITEGHKTWARAELLEITEASVDRTEPVCPLYGICGGCDLQHLSYDAQLDAKTAILRETFRRIGGFDPPVPMVIPSLPWEYRNRMQLHCIPQLHDISQKNAFGFKARKSNDIIPVVDCPVADPGIRAFLRNPAHGETACGESLPPSAPSKGRFAVFARDGLFLCEGGMQRGKTTILGREICLDASVFFQSNLALLEGMIAKLMEIAAGADRDLAMADLYCGVGTFACFLGGLFPSVDLLEENKTALALSRENFASCCKGVKAEYFALRDSAWPQLGRRGFGFIVADPPRTGLAPALASWLAESGPPILAYVSCSPATLARDSKILLKALLKASLKASYELAELYLYDFYPQTAHIETLAVFSKK